MPRKADELEFETIPLSAIRRAIVERVVESHRSIPVFHMHAQADATALMAAREARKQPGSTATVPTYNDFVIKIVAGALLTHRRFNAWFDPEEGLKIARQVNVGFAVATEHGVLLPTVFDADRKPVEAIAEETRELAGLARDGRLRASLQMGATFTISNVGPGAVDAFNAIISPPQTGILAVGALAPRPVVVGDQIAVRHTLNLTLSVDHRAADGRDGAAFLATVKRGIEEWEQG